MPSVAWTRVSLLLALLAILPGLEGVRIMGKSRSVMGGGTPASAKGKDSLPMFSFPDLDWKRDLRPQPELVEVTEGVFYTDNVFSESECQRLIEACIPRMENTNPRNLPPKKGEAFRNNDRMLFRDEEFAQKLWEKRLKPILQLTRPNDKALPTHLNPDIRVYRYQKGHSFGPHIDQPVVEGEYESEFTVLIYLQANDLKGGQTIFHTKPPVAVDPIPGRVLIHWTGRECLHEGALVTRGEKTLLRTDMFYPILR